MPSNEFWDSSRNADPFDELCRSVQPSGRRPGVDRAPSSLPLPVPGRGRVEEPLRGSGGVDGAHSPGEAKVKRRNGLFRHAGLPRSALYRALLQLLVLEMLWTPLVGHESTDRPLFLLLQLIVFTVLWALMVDLVCLASSSSAGLGNVVELVGESGMVDGLSALESFPSKRRGSTHLRSLPASLMAESSREASQNKLDRASRRTAVLVSACPASTGAWALWASSVKYMGRLRAHSVCAFSYMCCCPLVQPEASYLAGLRSRPGWSCAHVPRAFLDSDVHGMTGTQDVVTASYTSTCFESDGVVLLHGSRTLRLFLIFPHENQGSYRLFLVLWTTLCLRASSSL